MYVRLSDIQRDVLESLDCGGYLQVGQYKKTKWAYASCPHRPIGSSTALSLVRRGFVKLTMNDVYSKFYRITDLGRRVIRK